MMNLYREDGETASLWDMCEWWIELYPDDIFVENPKEIIQIRELMKKILKKRPTS